MLARTDAQILKRLNGEKRCRGCEQVKPTSEFPWDKQAQSPRSRCYPCTRIANRIYQQARAKPRKSRAKPDRVIQGQQIEAHLLSGMTRAQVHAQGFGWNYICKIAKKLGVPHQKPPTRTPPELIEAIRREIHSSKQLTFKQIGELVGITPSVVAGIVWRYGLNDLPVKPETFVVTYGAKISRKHKRSRRNRRSLSSVCP